MITFIKLISKNVFEKFVGKRILYKYMQIYGIYLFFNLHLNQLGTEFFKDKEVEKEKGRRETKENILDRIRTIRKTSGRIYEKERKRKREREREGWSEQKK